MVMVATKWAPREHGGDGCPTAKLGKPNTFESDEMETKQKGRETLTDGAGVAGQRDEGWKAEVGGDMKFRQGTRWRRRRDNCKKAIKRAREWETDLTGAGVGRELSLNRGTGTRK